MPDDFCRFMRSIKKSVSANVAFVIDGSPENAAKIVEMAKTNNTNVIEDDILYVKGGLPFKFAKGVSAGEMASVKSWCESILASLK
jgi:hypothetical protein